MNDAVSRDRWMPAEWCLDPPDWLVDAQALRSAGDEHAYFYLLTSQGAIADRISMTSGMSNMVEIGMPDLLRRALVSGAEWLALAHNHPSGDCRPSRSDIMVTRDLAQACRLLALNLVDHVIVARHASLSMRQLGLF